jgi:lactoylglutathione lyase
MIGNQPPGATVRAGENIGSAVRSAPPATQATRQPPAGLELVLEVDDVDAEHDRVVAAGWPLDADLGDLD